MHCILSIVNGWTKQDLSSFFMGTSFPHTKNVSNLYLCKYALYLSVECTSSREYMCLCIVSWHKTFWISWVCNISFRWVHLKLWVRVSMHRILSITNGWTKQDLSSFFMGISFPHNKKCFKSFPMRVRILSFRCVHLESWVYVSMHSILY